MLFYYFLILFCNMSYFKIQDNLFFSAPSNENTYPKDVTRIKKNHHKEGPDWKILVRMDFIEGIF